ncbi:MAG TPA: gamma-glutamyltransferase [Myxococcota bacterium]|nr:gamma-glutamyltransferase [Myxococcota bacterium]
MSRPSHRPWLRALAAAAVLAQALLGPNARGAAPEPAQGRRGMVVTSQGDATRAGLAMLEQGGNAVDAAVAAAFALAVTQPFSAGLGGGAFVLIRTADGRAVALDARETAPAAATADMFTRPGVPERASLVGPLAVATPSFVAGMALALERFGTRSLADVLAPAIELAEHGFPIGPYHARMLAFVESMGLRQRFPETARIQLPPPGETPRQGWRLVQKDLAETLRRIARDGPQTISSGDVAGAIADEVQADGGILTWEDLSGYQAKLREPLRGHYRSFEILSFPPPSSGGVALIEALQILDGTDLRARGAGSSAAIHLIAEAMKLAFADRALHLGDPDFVDVPVARLISPDYAAMLRARINPPWWKRAPWTWGREESAIEVEAPGIAADDHGTTHLSTTDAAGNAVALTMTINTPFGSGITVPGTGVVLNNEMDDFSVAPGKPNVYGLVDVRGANSIAPGKRPLSSMTPTIVLIDGRLVMVTGSPGGPRIISTTLLSILNALDFHMDVEEAVSAPRFHHQWSPDELVVEPDVPADVVEGLRARGHVVRVDEREWSAAEAILIDPKTGWHTGGADPRSDGLALGLDPPGSSH